MNTAAQDTKLGMEENDVVKQFMELLSQQDMGGQSQGFMEMLRYVAGMHLQLSVMADELQGVREQLAQLQESQPKTVTERLIDKIAQLQEKITNLSERLSKVKDCFMETAAEAVSAFKEKGKEGLCRAVQKGLSGIRSILAGCQEQMVDIKADYEKTANQIDRIGDELKQIGNSVSNVGRLLAGKGTKEVSDEKLGVVLTRMINKPVKSAAACMQKNIDMVDRVMEKLDKLSARFDVRKEAEKDGRSSVKDKLSQMRAKADQQKKASKPEKIAVRNKEECI